MSASPGDCQTLGCLEEMRCVAPLDPAPPFDACYNENIRATFDAFDGATVDVVCDAGFFIHGIEASPCQKLYCLETLRCCRYDTSQVQRYDGSNQMHSWQTAFDHGAPAGWVLVDHDEFVCGLRRSGGAPHELYQLEAAWTRRLKLATASAAHQPKLDIVGDAYDTADTPKNALLVEVRLSRTTLLFFALLVLSAVVCVVWRVGGCCRGRVTYSKVDTRYVSDTEAEENVAINDGEQL